jgi:phenylalanine-4-hydroxylase
MVLGMFQRHGVNLTRIESKPAKIGRGYEFDVDCDGDADDKNVSALLRELRHSAVTWTLHAPSIVPWFPLRISDIDKFSTKTLDAGSELESDHPGFADPG